MFRRISSGLIRAGALLAAVCPSGARSADGGIDAICARGTLIVAIHHDDWPPFFYTDASGQLTGLDIELSRSMAKMLGVQVRFNRDALTFDGIVDEVVEGRADVAIAYLSNTLDRGMIVRFTQPYVQLNQAILVNRLQRARWGNSRGIDEVLDSPVARIAVRTGSAAGSYARSSYPRATIVEGDSDTVLIADVRSGQVTAYLSDEMEIRDLLSQHPEAAIDTELVILRDQPDTIAMAVSMGNPDLHYWANLYLDQIRMNGILASLLKHYIETDAWRREYDK